MCTNDSDSLKALKKIIYSPDYEDIKLGVAILKRFQYTILDYCFILDMEQKIREAPFYISKYPVSDGFIQKVMKKQSLTYYDYENFISRLNDETGKHFFIPTVEQWEFGVQSSNIWRVENCNTLKNNNAIPAESNISCDRKTQSQGGLFDMSGNLGELCRSSDEKSDVCYIKGGSYKSARIRCRIDYTDVKFKHIPLKNVGLRLCL